MSLGELEPERKSGSQFPPPPTSQLGKAVPRAVRGTGGLHREDILGFVLHKEQLGDILVNNGEGKVEDSELLAARPGKR